MAVFALVVSLLAPLAMNFNISDELNQRFSVMQQEFDQEQAELVREIDGFSVQTQSLAEQLISSTESQQDLRSSVLGDVLPAADKPPTDAKPFAQRLVSVEQTQLQIEQEQQEFVQTLAALREQLAAQRETQEAIDDPVNWRLHSVLQNLAKQGEQLKAGEGAINGDQLAWLKRVNYTVQSLPSVTLAGANLDTVKTEMSLIEGLRGEYSVPQTAVMETLILLQTLQSLARSALL